MRVEFWVLEDRYLDWEAVARKNGWSVIDMVKNLADEAVREDQEPDRGLEEMF